MSPSSMLRSVMKKRCQDAPNIVIVRSALDADVDAKRRQGDRDSVPSVHYGMLA